MLQHKQVWHLCASVQVCVLVCSCTPGLCPDTQSKHVCTAVCVCVKLCICMCVYLCVCREYTHSDLWECRMSNTVDVLLFQRNIIIYFYMALRWHLPLLPGHHWSFTLSYTARCHSPSNNSLCTHQAHFQEPGNDSLCNLMCGFDCCNLPEICYEDNASVWSSGEKQGGKYPRIT